MVVPSQLVLSYCMRPIVMFQVLCSSGNLIERFVDACEMVKMVAVAMAVETAEVSTEMRKL